MYVTGPVLEASVLELGEVPEPDRDKPTGWVLGVNDVDRIIAGLVSVVDETGVCELL